jgi:hypothetical protein
VPQPRVSQPDVPQEASPEEEPFEIELVVPESPTAQDSSAEEQQWPKDHDIEDKTNKEYTPSSNAENEKMYRDADEVESFGIEAPVLTYRLQALLEHLGITTAQGSPAFRAGGVQGHRRDFLRIQSPLLTQGTSFQDFSQRCCC